MVVAVGIWSPVAERCEAALAESFESVAEGYYVKVTITELDRVEVQKEPLVMKLQSTGKTTVRCAGAASLKIVPNPTLVVRRFHGLGQPEMHLHAVGVLTELEAMRSSQEGKSMRQGVLTGEDGYGLRLMFFQTWTEESDLKIGARLCCWYLQSKLGLKTGPGFYWCYDEAFCLVLGQAKSLPSTHTIEEIGGEEEEPEE
jgi:hypothetical protein